MVFVKEKEIFLLIDSNKERDKKKCELRINQII